MRVRDVPPPLGPPARLAPAPLLPPVLPVQADQRAGTVSLVGAGPGDAELLTLRALRRLQQADVVVHDALVGADVLALIAPAAERIDVGKRARRHSVPQPDTNALLVRLARRGMRVVRLKGGDPFMFGRGGEEAEYLIAHGVPFEVVPGVTSAAGAASCAGIPLTHRDHAHACVFVTGHLCDERASPDWAALARPRQTLVIYMGLGAVASITAQLAAHGLPAHTPAAAVERATTAHQRVVTATLATLAEEVTRAALGAPTILIVGEVVRLRDTLVAQPHLLSEA